MKSIVAPRRPGESDEEYRERVNKARRRRGIAQLPLPIGNDVDLKMKVVGDDDTTKEVTLVPDKYAGGVQLLEKLLVARCYEAMLKEFGYGSGFFVLDGEVYVKPDGDGESQKIKILAALDTD